MPADAGTEGDLDAPVDSLGDTVPVTMTVYEGHACSADPADDPQLVCTRSPELACVSTYSAPTSTGNGPRPVFVCRLPCQAFAGSCPQPGDRCCSGRLAGGSGLTPVCVPAAYCQSVDGGP